VNNQLNNREDEKKVTLEEQIKKYNKSSFLTNRVVQKSNRKNIGNSIIHTHMTFNLKA
jgi:hypothetical protein